MKHLMAKIFLILFNFILITSANYDSIQTSNGDHVRCIDKMKQPAFQDPLLKHHKLQEFPSEIPTRIESNKKGKWLTMEAYVSTARCPEGMIPALQYWTKPHTHNYTGHTSQHEYAEVTTHASAKLFGTRTIINVWDPKVEDKETEFSLAQLWIAGGDYDNGDLNTIEVGWQVHPDLYNDNKPRLFVYWARDAYKITGGYNIKDPGFIQTSSNIVIGGTITPISSFGGIQYEITVLVWKDRTSGNWWLCLGSNNSPVGYWPREIFTNLADHATSMDFGGEIVNSNYFGRHTKTQMGSGRFPEEGFGRASYFRNIEVLDNTNNNLKPIREFYNIKNLKVNDEWGVHFFFGGPGFGYTHSGVLAKDLNLLFIYFSFSLFIVI